MESQRIAGRYLVLRAIGRGGMGVVWLCRDEVLGREVAVKQIGGLPGEPEVETMRAMREARSAAALNHPNVVAVYDVVNHDGRPWLVMEYVDGQTLAEILADEGRLPPPQVAGIGALLADALDRAHERGIVHRDVKPGNVLVDRSGRPKVSDFGIARGHGDDQLTQTGFVSGTPGYLSPELARGGDPDPASDVWALGATLYVAVEGQAPYESRSNPLALLREIATEPPRPMQHAGALAPAIAAMMDQDPARRWDMATAARRLGEISRGDTSLLEATQVSATQGDSTQLLTTAAPLEATQRMAVPPAARATAPGAVAEPSPPESRAGAVPPPGAPPPPSPQGDVPAGGCRSWSSSSCSPRSAPTWSARWVRTRPARARPRAPAHRRRRARACRRRAAARPPPARRAAPPPAAPRRPPPRPAARRRRRALRAARPRRPAHPRRARRRRPEASPAVTRHWRGSWRRTSPT